MGNTVPAAPRAASPERGHRPANMRDFSEAQKAIYAHGAIAAVRLLLENEAAALEAMGQALEHTLRSTSERAYHERATIAGALSILSGRRRAPAEEPPRASHVEAALEETSARLEAIIEAGLDARLSRVEGQLVDLALRYDDRLTKLETTDSARCHSAHGGLETRVDALERRLAHAKMQKAGAAAPEIVAPMAPPLSESAAALEKARAQVSDRRTLSVGADA